MKSLQKKIDTKLQMSCKQIGDLTGVRHDSVKRAGHVVQAIGVLK